MRGLQLIIVLSTTFVLIAISGWALWHIWQEQELPVEPVRPSYIYVAPDGRAFYKSSVFDLSVADPGAPDEAVRALEEALRHSLGKNADLRNADGTWRVPIVIVTDRKTEPAHVERIRRTCSTVGLTDVTVRTRQANEHGGKDVGAEDSQPKQLLVNLRVGGWVYLKTYEFWLEWPSQGERHDAVMAFKDALRTIIDDDPVLGEALRSGARPLVMSVDAEAKAEHIETLRAACQERKIKRIEVRTKTP